MTEFEPLPAKAVLRIRREAKSKGLDEVGCAWSILAEQDRVIVSQLMSLLPGPRYMDPPDGGEVSIMEQLRRMADDAARWRNTADQLREAQRAVAEECVKLCELSAENMAADAAEDVRALALVMRSMYLCAKGE